MDQKLRLAFQGIHGAVAKHSKLASVIHFTCIKSYSSVPSAFVKLVYLNLSSILVEGRGLHLYNLENQNSIVLNFRGTDVTTLPPESVKVHFSRLGAEVVDVKCGGGIVEIVYRATGTDALGLTVSVYDQIVFKSIAQETVSLVFPASTVLSGLRNGREVDVRFTEWLPGKKTRLLYRSSRDGASAASFHASCDGQGPTVTLIKCTDGYVFGGYAGVAWSSAYGWHACPSAFLFTVTNPHGDPITRFMSDGDGGAVGCFSDCGPLFGGGHDLYVSGAFDGTSCTNFPFSYYDTRGRGNATFTGALYFTPAEAEVWAME